MVNIARPEEVDRIDVTTCDGVGLMRTEFLFSGDTLPDEETQYRAYTKVLEWAGGRPVTIRTVDAGGDKPVKGLTVEEPNPFLGLRGIRLSLARPEIFRVQLRALARAAVGGNLKVMLPMVTVPAEIEAARNHLDAVLGELAAEGIAAARPSLGIMVEVPAVAIEPKAYAAAEFFSIGSNDLTQYVTAAARDSHRVADLCDVTQPGGDEAHRRRRRLRQRGRHRGQPLRRRGRRSGARACSSSRRGCAACPSRRRCSGRSRRRSRGRGSMSERAPRGDPAASAGVAEYKAILQRVLESRPSGHAAAHRHGARQEPQLRHADHLDRLRHADPGAPRRPGA